jgi:2-polyprenyl-3-methyl-5-hydroxy-6-metoxy-1,4-benzoquinol methylase
MREFVLTEHLACPIHRTPLQQAGDTLRCSSGCEYPVFNGIPFLLSAKVEQTSDVMADESFELAEKLKSGSDDAHARNSVPKNGIDPRVQDYVAHTNSHLYKSLVGKLDRYPIPEFPMQPSSDSPVVLDIGCGWGRWCFAAAQRGFVPVGIDPSLPHVLAAQRVAKQLGLKAHFVVADSRYLPFQPDTFDAAFSFSVLQHLSRENVELTLQSLSPLMKQGGTSMLHIINWLGLRSLQVQLRRGFRDGPDQFDTRYWSIPDALETFSKKLGPSRVEIDGYFVQARYEDRHLLTASNRAILEISRALTKASHVVPLLSRVADNIWIISKTQSPQPQGG